jgi:hypothetical protein
VASSNIGGQGPAALNSAKRCNQLSSCDSNSSPRHSSYIHRPRKGTTGGTACPVTLSRDTAGTSACSGEYFLRHFGEHEQLAVKEEI